MKKISLVIQGILLIAVIGLYVLFFTQKSSSSAGIIGDGDPDSVAAAIVGGEIVFVNIDSLMENYQMVQDLRETLTQKFQKLDTELKNKAKKHQADIADYQNKGQKGLETRARLAEMEQQLMINEQNLMNLQNEYSMQLGEEEQVMNRQILNNIMDYLKEYNVSKGYQYILGNSFGSNLLYANQGLDITSSVLAGINAKYKAEKAAKSSK